MEIYDISRQATDGSITRCVCFACWVTKAADTHLECAILTAFLQQQLLEGRISILHLYVY